MDVFLKGTQIEGEVSLMGANISGQLACAEGTTLSNPGGFALNAEGCQVEGALFLRLGGAAVGSVDLGYAQIGTLGDDLASWPGLPYTYILEGLSYHSLGGDQNLDRRLDWITSGKAWALRNGAYQGASQTCHR